MSALDAGRVVRGLITAALVHDAARHRTHPDPAVAGCEAQGWLVRAGCTDHKNRVVCPLCRGRVSVTRVRAGVVRIDPHLDPTGAR